MSLQRTPVSPLSRSGGEAGRSLMIPRGVGAPPPPGMDPRRGKLMCIKVRLLDDSVGVFHLGHKALGQALFDEVCRHLNLLESDYFGLEFADCYGNHCWLDKDKAILRQITTKQSDARFYFIVKFYTPNPADLEEEYTRYLLALQIRRDLATGEMICNENTAALLASYIVQADCGDFSPDDYPDHSYLASGRFLPNQTADFQRKVMENHQKLTGMGPGESDLALLETARRCDFYGVKLHAAKDVEGTDVSLTVAHLGIRVFHQLQCVSTFSWAKIRKLSFKRRKLLIKLHPESYQYYKETIEFSFDNRNECKNFWKKCVEHHAFFRCAEIELPRKSETRLFSRGSSFRYHGRTQKQLIDYVREHRKRREPFTRPIKPGLSSRSERISRPALYNVNSGYSTVSDRAINVVTGIPPSSVTASQEQAQPSSGSVPRINGHHHAHHHHQTPQQPPTQQAPNVSDAVAETKSEISVGEYAKVRVQKVSAVGVNSTFSSVGVCVVSPLEIRRNPPISTIRSTESSDSGAITVNEGDMSPAKGKPIAVKPYRPCCSGSRSADLLNENGNFVTNAYDDSLPRTKPGPNTKSYHVFTDFVMLERTAVFELKILSQDFRRLFADQMLTSGRALNEFFESLKPLHSFHEELLSEFESKTLSWEGCTSNRGPTTASESSHGQLGDLLLCAVHNVLHLYRKFTQQLPIYMAAIDELSRTNSTFRASLAAMEESPFCYQSVNFLLLKVAHRMVVWQNSIARLVEALLEEGDNTTTASHLSSCRVALEKVASFNAETVASREGIVNFVKLLELERDLSGIDNLLLPNRRFVREGWLRRWSSRGLVERIFVLFNDSLLFAHRSAASNTFVVSGLIPLRGMLFEEGDAYHVTTDATTCITIYGGKRSILLSATCTAMKDLWMDELANAIRNAKQTRIELLPQAATLRQQSTSDDFDNVDDRVKGKIVQSETTMDGAESGEPGKRTESSSRSSTLHVCWHRQTTVGFDAILNAPSNQMSGYLLRKFRNSAGWQRLWVVLSNFTLFFYKSHQEESPLANLPLLDYTVSLPSLLDEVNKEYVMKLSYKTHFYFFRTDNSHSFSRWMESIRSATLNFAPFVGISCRSPLTRSP